MERIDRRSLTVEVRRDLEQHEIKEENKEGSSIHVSTSNSSRSSFYEQHQFVPLSEGKSSSSAPSVSAYSTFGPLLTSNNGDCLIHAIFGKPTPNEDDLFQIKCDTALNLRRILSEQILNSVEESRQEVLELHSFDEETNGVHRSRQNLNSLAQSLAGKGFLGLEHAELIAKSRRRNILVINEKTEEEVRLSYNEQSTDPDHIIYFDGINHWSKGGPADHPLSISSRDILPIGAEEALKEPFKEDAEDLEIFYRLYHSANLLKWDLVLKCCEYYAGSPRLEALFDARGRTVYDLLIYSGNLTAIKMLDGEGASIKESQTSATLKKYLSAGGRDEEPLNAAIRSGKQAVFDYLAEKTTPSTANLRVAIECKKPEIARVLIRKMQASEVFRLFEGDDGIRHNAFSYCIRHDIEAIFDILTSDQRLKRSADVAIRHKIEGVGNLLHLAISSFSDKSLKYLLSRHRDLVEPLVAENSYPYSPKDQASGVTPLQYSALIWSYHSFSTIIKEFPEQISQVNQDGHGRTVAHSAALSGFKEGLIRIYRKDRRLLDASDMDGITPNKILEDKHMSISNMLKAATEYIERIGHSLEFLPPQNLVFSGGGPRGLAYVGALKALENKRLLREVENICGTSAGAITASLLAIGLRGEEVKEFSDANPLLELLDFNQSFPCEYRSFFESENFRRILKEGNLQALSQDVAWIGILRQGRRFVRGAVQQVGQLLNPSTAPERLVELATGFFGLLFQAASGRIPEHFKELLMGYVKRINESEINGLCEGKILREAIEGAIREKTGIHNCTFGELAGLIKKNPRGPFSHLYIYGTNVSSSRTELFSTKDEACKDYIISDIVRISMSIPFLFRPHEIHIKAGGSRMPLRNEDIIKHYVDGGLLRNCPMNSFDEEGVKNERTLGFKFSETGGRQNRPTISGGLWGIGELYYAAEEHLANEQEDRRVISIDPVGAGMLSFDMNQEEQQKLIAQGEQDTMRFILASREQGYFSSQLEHPTTPVASQRRPLIPIPLRVDTWRPELECSISAKIQNLAITLIKATNDKQIMPALHTELPLVFASRGMDDLSQEKSLALSVIQNMGALNPVIVDDAVSYFVNNAFSVNDLEHLKVIADRVKTLFSVSSQLLEKSKKKASEGALVMSGGVTVQSWAVLKSIQGIFENRVLTLEKAAAIVENSVKDRQIAQADRRRESEVRRLEEERLLEEGRHLTEIQCLQNQLREALELKDQAPERVSPELITRVKQMGLHQVLGSREFRSAAESRINRMQSVLDWLRRFEGLLTDNVLGSLPITLQRKTPFVVNETTQTKEELQTHMALFRNTEVDNKRMEEELINNAWEHIMHWISHYDSGIKNRNITSGYWDVIQRGRPNVTITGELRSCLDNVHETLQDTLLRYCLQLVIPRFDQRILRAEQEAHLRDRHTPNREISQGTTRVDWMRREEGISRNQKRYHEKLLEIVSRVLAIRWCQENTKLLQKYLG